MHNTTTIPIIRLLEVADKELIRLDFKTSTLNRHSKEFRNFLNYCRENAIENYCAETGTQYFKYLYDLNIGDSTVKLTKPQLDTRCSIRFLDDIFQFGYALRNSHHDYTVPCKYIELLEDYLRILFNCGLRTSELLKLRICDVDLDECVFTVLDTKFHKSRLVPFSEVVSESLKQYLEI